ncbi:MAG: hypothetical protein JWM98_2578 [Thermoleophilia bacterium]|nr:hypothetical protein [Thermoleophilia bacterium]
MSVGSMAALPRAATAQDLGVGLRSAPEVEGGTPTVGGVAVPTVDGDGAGAQALPPTITDAQGRVFTLGQDPATGHPQYRHASEQHDEAGSRLELEIVIDLAEDGSFSRKTSQSLSLASGDSQREVVLASYAADGTQVGETTDSTKHEGEGSLTEHTVGTFAAGQLVRRETDIVNVQAQTDPTTHEATRIEAKVHGTWDGGGKPITDATVPTVDRTERQQVTTPGGGINKDTSRTLTFTRHGAGPLDALAWDAQGTLLVRFEGHGGQYIEREMTVPLRGAEGAPSMDDAVTVRTDDHQDLVNKGLTQARVWGGLVSNLSWVAGINFAKGSLGKGLLGLSAAAAGVELVGEGHAVATKRNDGDWGRVASSAYDLLLTGMLGAYMSGRKDVGTQLSTTQRVGLSALGGAGLVGNATELLGRSPIGAGALSGGLASAGIGADLLPAPTSRLDTQWRLEPRFDAGSALAG